MFEEFGISTDSQFTSLSYIMSDYEEFLSLDESYKAYSKEVISAWQQSDKANKKAWETLSNSSEAAMMVTKYIANSIGSEGYTEAEEKNREKWREY